MRLAAASQEAAAKRHELHQRWGEAVRAFQWATEAHVQAGDFESAERCARELCVAAERWAEVLATQAEKQQHN